MQTLGSLAIAPTVHSAIVARGYQPTPVPPVRSTARARAYEKDEEIFCEGDSAPYFYQVISGAVRTSTLLVDGRRQIDAFHLPGDIFGIEISERRRFSAEAIGAARVLAYRRCTLEALASSDTELACKVVKALMASLKHAQDHMVLLGRRTALEKIATFLLDLADRAATSDKIELPMQRLDIADYLGLTIETVSRSLTELERRAVIGIPTSRTIELRDRAALTRLHA